MSARRNAVAGRVSVRERSETGPDIPPVEGDVEDHVRLFAEPRWLALHHEVKVAQRRNFLRDLGLAEDSTVLDVACGVGGWSWLIRTEVPGSAVVGVDSSIDNLREAVRPPAASVPGCRPRFVAGSAHQLPFLTGSFGVVLVINALQYASVAHALPELYRLLKKGGRLIIRNFDEGFSSVVPCRPALLGKVLWAAAEETLREGVHDVDPYVGRRVGQLLSQHFEEPVMTWVTASTLRWPFTEAEQIYVTRNLEWLGECARELLDPAEVEAWSQLTRTGDPNCIFDNREASHTIVDFCAELTKTR